MNEWIWMIYLDIFLIDWGKCEDYYLLMTFMLVLQTTPWKLNKKMYSKYFVSESHMTERSQSLVQHMGSFSCCGWSWLAWLLVRLDDQEVNNAEDDGKHNECNQGNDTNKQGFISLPKKVELHLERDISAWGWWDAWGGWH